MDFHLATPTGDVLLFSSEDGRAVHIPAAPAAASNPAAAVVKSDPAVANLASAAQAT